MTPAANSIVMPGYFVYAVHPVGQPRSLHIMREDEEVELLSKVDIFESLSEEEIRQLLRQNPDVHLREGEVFYAPREPDGRLYILKKGKVRIYRTEGAREFTL